MERMQPPPVPPEQILSPRSYAARGQRVEARPDKLCLVIDLDETLVYALRKDRTPPPVLSAKEMTPGLPELESCVVVLGDERFDVLLRPGAVEFLHKMSRLYTCFLYTMGTQEYVSQVLPVLDPEGEVFPPGQVCVWTPEHDRTTKELARVGVDERSVLVIDDALYAWREHVPNLILISRFVGDRRDSALHVLPQYLRHVHSACLGIRAGAPAAPVGGVARDARVVLSELCRPLMAHVELSLTGYKHPTAEAMREEPACRLAVRFGASLSFSVRASTTHLVVRDSGSGRSGERPVDWSQSPKVRQATRESAERAKEGREPICVVSEAWLLQCFCSLWPVDEGPYLVVTADGTPTNPPPRPELTTTPAEQADAAAA